MHIMRNILRTAAAALAAICVTACDNSPKFHVEGNITGAKDSLLFFENMSLNGPVTIDSVRLDEEGHFAFADKATPAPEFYRLRIAGQIINISADSTETVTVKAGYPTMATDYEVAGSTECERIRQLSLKQIALQESALALERNTALTSAQRIDSLEKMLNAYKEEVKMEYISKDPKAASSYFALFQTLGDFLIFDPRTIGEDVKMFAAVATSWDTYYPGAERGENLHNIAIEGLKTQKIIKQKSETSLAPAQVTTSGIIDLTLTDNRGRKRSLSSLKGRVVLLDYHLFDSAESPRRILMLRELYGKYHDRGLEIYQIAIDADEHYWKQQTSSLPWICVLAPDGPASSCVRTYNVSSIPEFFLIDRENNLVSRSAQVKDLEAEIEALL